MKKVASDQSSRKSSGEGIRNDFKFGCIESLRLASDERG
jgi:hypothetical protein